MSILTWIEDKKRLKVLNAPKQINSTSDSSKGLWTRCDKCGVILYIKHLKENQRVCFGCSYHLQMMSQERIENLLDKVPHERKASNMVSTWRPLDETVSPCDPLKFIDQKNYTDRLQDAQEKTGLQDAIQTGSGMIDGIPVALAVMDFSFMGGSMGSVVGEKITRLIEYATQEGLTLIIVSASGGARMQEGVFSLMQMAKISSALQIYQSCAKLLYISILTSPTTGGVTASFAMLGDIIFAEPKALIAFAGRRVIEQTLCEDLPDDFQTSEYMLHHGLVDLIVPRRFLRQALSESIKLYQNAPFKKIGRIPFGIQNPINFITEEKIRRQWNRISKKDKNLKLFSELVQEERSEKLIDIGNQRAFLSELCNAEDEKFIGRFVPYKSSQDLSSKVASFARRCKPTVCKERGTNVVAVDQSINGALGTFDVIENEKNKKSKYREILTSFQIMLSLFSHQINEKYKSGTFFANPACVQSAALYEPPSSHQHVRVDSAPPSLRSHIRGFTNRDGLYRRDLQRGDAKGERNRLTKRSFVRISTYKAPLCKPSQNDRLDFHTNKAYIHYVKAFLTKKKMRTNRTLKEQVLQKAKHGTFVPKFVRESVSTDPISFREERQKPKTQGFSHKGGQRITNAAHKRDHTKLIEHSRESFVLSLRLLTKRSFVRITKKSGNQTELKKLYTGHVRPRSSTFFANPESKRSFAFTYKAPLCKATFFENRRFACTSQSGALHAQGLQSGALHAQALKSSPIQTGTVCKAVAKRSFAKNVGRWESLYWQDECKERANVPLLVNPCLERPVKSTVPPSELRFVTKQGTLASLDVLCTGRSCISGKRCKIDQRQNQDQNLQLRKGVIRSISKIKHRFSMYELAFVPCLLTTRRFTQTIADARKQVLTNLSLGAHSSKRLTSFVFSNKMQSNSESFDQIHEQGQRRASKINPQLSDLSIKLSLNTLNQALELAATESVEWRAFYMDQQLSESMMSNDNYLKDANILFYRSILR